MPAIGPYLPLWIIYVAPSFGPVITVIACAGEPDWASMRRTGRTKKKVIVYEGEEEGETWRWGSEGGMMKRYTEKEGKMRMDRFGGAKNDIKDDLWYAWIRSRTLIGTGIIHGSLYNSRQPWLSGLRNYEHIKCWRRFSFFYNVFYFWSICGPWFDHAMICHMMSWCLDAMMLWCHELRLPRCHDVMICRCHRFMQCVLDTGAIQVSHSCKLHIYGRWIVQVV